MRTLTAYRGAYCAAVIITLLDLPLELPRESPAWSREGATFLTGLPEWLARCRSFFFDVDESMS
jgi:protein farnesyltransferase subunit beta